MLARSPETWSCGARLQSRSAELKSLPHPKGFSDGEAERYVAAMEKVITKMASEDRATSCAATAAISTQSIAKEVKRYAPNPGDYNEPQAQFANA